MDKMRDFPCKVYVGKQDFKLPPKEPLIKLVTREEWGADPPKATQEMTLPISHVRYNQTHSNECTTQEECTALVKKIQAEQMAKDLPDISYNFLIGGDGTFYEGRGWSIKPKQHTALKDIDYFDVAYIGTFNNKESPNWEQSVAAQRFLRFALDNEYLNSKYKITNLHEISD